MIILFFDEITAASIEGNWKYFLSTFLHCILIWIKVAWFERQAFRKSIISWKDRWFIFSSLKKEMQWNDGYLLAALELFPELKQYQMLLQGCWNRGREAWGPTGPSNSRQISPYSNRGRVDYAHQLVKGGFFRRCSCGKVCLISECIIIFTFCPKTLRGNFVDSIFELFLNKR